MGGSDRAGGGPRGGPSEECCATLRRLFIDLGNNMLALVLGLLEARGIGGRGAVGGGASMGGGMCDEAPIDRTPSAECCRLCTRSAAEGRTLVRRPFLEWIPVRPGVFSNGSMETLRLLFWSFQVKTGAPESCCDTWSASSDPPLVSLVSGCPCLCTAPRLERRRGALDAAVALFVFNRLERRRGILSDEGAGRGGEPFEAGV